MNMGAGLTFSKADLGLDAQDRCGGRSSTPLLLAGSAQGMGDTSSTWGGIAA